MQTTFSSTKRSSSISINFIVSQDWHELSDKQLRYVYQLIADNFATDDKSCQREQSQARLSYVECSRFCWEEIKTLCLLRWSGTKVIGRQDSSQSEATPSVSGSYLLKKGKILFEITPLTLAELLPHLDWLGSLPTAPVRLSKINRQNALPADFSEVSFADFIICDNLYQGYLQTQNEELLDQLGATLYGSSTQSLGSAKNSIDFKSYERISIFYWFASLKDWFARKYSDFFQPVEATTGCSSTQSLGSAKNLLGAPSMNVEEAMNAQPRVLCPFWSQCLRNHAMGTEL